VKAQLTDDMLKTAIHAVTKAGEFVASHFHEQSAASATLKTENDTFQSLTPIDIESEKLIMDILQPSFPNHAFFGEEGGKDDVSSDFLWIIDPIDGTSNYSRQVPFFCVTAALTFRDEPVLGVVYQPLTKELFTAIKGRGAHLNGQAIQPSDLKDLSQAFVCFDKGKSQAERQRFPKIIDAMTPHIRSPRALGAGALQSSYAACGKFDAGIFNGMAFYDVAASSVIAKEAGASVTDFSGHPWNLKSPEMLICHPQLTRQITGILSRV
jgi:myo-inositol-1(or 4)-monophosphatase